MRLGTRGSKLALIQAEQVKAAFQKARPGLSVEIKVITTTGDMRSGHKTLDKKEWIEQLEDALVSNQIDYAVHSAKDVPADVHPQTELCSVLKRVNPLDVVISRGKEVALVDFEDGAKIGTSSLRRKEQLSLVRPDLVVQSLRGNVPTRLSKCLEQNECDAMIIAAAGIQRLALEEHVSFKLPFKQMIPAACQGTLALQYRLGEAPHRDLIDPEAEQSFQFERAIVRELEADCSSALGVFHFQGEMHIRICGDTVLDYSAPCADQKQLEAVLENLRKRDAKKLVRNISIS